jgi:hypothetical protein
MQENPLFVPFGRGFHVPPALVVLKIKLSETSAI